MVVVAFALLLLPGCATHITKPTKEPTAAKIQFGEFTKVEMKAVDISEEFGAAEANQRALRKIDEFLFRDMKMIFPGLVRIESGREFSRSNERILQITPYVKEIKFIGGGARFWAGAMAGSSAVLMQTTYRDSINGAIIADPEFYRVGNAWAGGWSIGATDNRMLEDIAADFVQYSRNNK